ncbi:MOSC domain-containing protein [Kribbella antibiotica]|uniref:MOSC domain-containing protein n=1 Tax=Kribbella antibiotica TaxID=190195 RepID=UPI00192D3504|nr:MOSC domain-containing protein [Kribbella antibiotica]
MSATTAADGAILVDGHEWTSAAAAAAVTAAAGPGASLAVHHGKERFDILPLLVATDGGIKALGYDGRRLRPNLVIGGVPDLRERDWPGQALRIGDVVIGIESLRGRCIVTTIDPDTGVQDLDVLRRIHRSFEGKVALNCWVAQGGTIRVGDPVELIDEELPRPPRGGWILGAPYLVP